MRRPDRPRMDMVVAKHCMRLVEELILEQLDGRPNRVMTLDEVIDLMDMSKSCGWPYDIKYKTKSQFVNSEDIGELHKYWDALCTDAPILDLETLFLKKEPRPIGKQPRCVFGLGVRKTMCENRLTKMLTENLRHSWQNIFYEKGWFAFGMPASKGNWDKLARNYEGWDCFELDGSSWDASMFPWLIEQFSDIHVRLMTDLTKEDEQRIRNIYTTGYWTISILPGGKCVFRWSGNGSGHPLTTFWNMKFAAFSTFYGHHRQTPGVIYPLSFYKGKLRCIEFGDDNIVCIKRGANIKFDINEFRRINYEELYCQYTASLKSPLTDLRFFNFGWVLRLVRGVCIWAPDPDVKKILYSLNYPTEPLSVRRCLERSLSIRQTAFNNPNLFVWVDGFCRWLQSQVSGMMPAKIHTVAELEDLYFGWETPDMMPLLFSGVTKVVAQSALEVVPVKLPPHRSLKACMSKKIRSLDEYIDNYYKKKEYLEHPLGAVGRKVSDVFYEGVVRPYGKLVDYFRMPKSKKVTVIKKVRTRPKPVGIRKRPTLGKRARTVVVKRSGKVRKSTKGISMYKAGPMRTLNPIAAAYPMAERPTSFKIIKGLPGGGLRVCGSDYLTTLDTSSIHAVGDLIYSFDVNPSLMGQRLAVFSELYEMFWCRRLSVLYEPASSVQNEGAMIGFFEIDVKDSLPTGISAVRFAQNHAGASYCNVYSPHIWSKPFQKTRNDMYIESQGSDVRFTNQARFNLLAQVAIEPTKLKGSLRVDWEFDLFGPQLRPGTGGMYLLTAETNDFELASATTWNPSEVLDWFAQCVVNIDDTGGGICTHSIISPTVLEFKYQLPPGRWLLEVEQNIDMDITTNAGAIALAYSVPIDSEMVLSDTRQDGRSADVSNASLVARTFATNPTGEDQTVVLHYTLSGTVNSVTFKSNTSTLHSFYCVVAVPQVPNDNDIFVNKLRVNKGLTKHDIMRDEISRLLNRMEAEKKDKNESKEEKREVKKLPLARSPEFSISEPDIVLITPKKTSSKGSTSSAADALRKG